MQDIYLVRLVDKQKKKVREEREEGKLEDRQASGWWKNARQRALGR